MLDKITAQTLAKQLKIDLFTIYREYLQLLLLKHLYSQKESEHIYFKGGTSLRFLYGSFRFSEDLDFTSLISEKIAIKSLIQKTIKKLYQEAGEVIFKESESMAEAFGGRIFQHIEEFNFPLTVRLDFSLRETPLLPRTSYLETIFPISPYPLIAHLGQEEIMAEKIRAMLSRVRGRDLFDLWFLLSKKIPIDWALVNKKMALYGKTADHNALTHAVEKLPDEEIQSDLAKFLPVTHRSLIAKLKSLTLEKLHSELNVT